ncbi:MAG: efflux transporter outer membrane subunit [Candidatus Azobacteroides sp.]|nr:efflux transporter outer membrane subunit [Candidatus Azobacteroides sp.]
MIRRNIYKFILPGLLIPVVFQSCQVTNKYKTPELDTAGLYREMTASDTTTIATIPWEDYFQDTYLRALIGEGLENNYDMRIAYTRIQQAETSLSIAKAAYFPDVALVGQVSHNRYSLNPVDGKRDVLGYHSEDYTLGISASWELDIWGKMNREARASYAQFLATHAYKNLIQISLVANIATSYYSLLALDEQLRITLQTIDLLQESAETMQAMMEAGMLTAAAVEQSRALLYSTQITVPDLEAQIRQMENAISVLVGRNPGPIERSSIHQQYVVGVLDHGVPAQMLSQRPDVQQAELAFRSAFELTNAAQAALYPSVKLSSGTIGYGASSLSNFFRADNLFVSLIGGLTQPIFAKKQLTGQLKIRKAQQEEALLTFEQTVLNAGQEISNILFSYEYSLKKNGVRQQQVNSLLNAVEYTQALLLAGEANYTEVLSAEQSLLQAQLEQVSDKLEQLQYSVNLYRALGGGLE